MITCERCGTNKRPSRHHILPKRFFGGRGQIGHLCVWCHREIEAIILQEETRYTAFRSKLPERIYADIFYNFIQT